MIILFFSFVSTLKILNNITKISFKVRALAANTALIDAFKLSDVLTRARDIQASGEALKDLVSAFNVDMLVRGKAASVASNSLLETYGKGAKFITFGKEAVPMPPKAVVLSEVGIAG